MSDIVLSVDGVTAGFGVTTVLHGVDLAVGQGQVAGVFGLNGAGKSVTMKVLAGIVPARSGSVTFLGQDITHASPEVRVRLGMAHVPQGRQVFAALTVEQNLRLGAYTLRQREKAKYGSVLDVCDSLTVLSSGEVIASGDVDDVAQQGEVSTAYLGEAVPA